MDESTKYNSELRLKIEIDIQCKKYISVSLFTALLKSEK